MKGRVVGLSLGRRIVCDYMWLGRSVPVIPIERTMALAELRDARTLAEDRPAWTAIFAKAFSILAMEQPIFRQAYVLFPRPGIYQYPASIATIAVERDVEGAPTVLAAHSKAPERFPLAETDRLIKTAARAPLHEIKHFRHLMAIARLPRPLRRLLLRLVLATGRLRANYIGTFSISVVSSMGSDVTFVPSPCTYLLNYGVIGGDGRVVVRLMFDHRVVDGAAVARALERLEEILLGPVLAEIGAIAHPAVGSMAYAAPADLRTGFQCATSSA